MAKILMVSTDESIMREGSEAYLRMREYGNLFSELHIILFSKKEEREREIRKNVFVYPVYSVCRFFIPFKAFWRARKIIKNDKKVLRLNLGASDKKEALRLSSETKIKGEWVVTTQDPFETGLVGFLLKVFYKIGWQAQIHTDFLSPFFFGQSFLNKVRVIVARVIIWKADRVRVVSERIKKSLVKIGFSEEKIDVLPIAVQAEEIKNMPISFNLREKFPEADFIIFMASRLTPEKNVRLALAAFSEVLKKRLGIMKLVIAGDGPCKEDLEEEAKKRGIYQDVEFLGELSYQDVISGMKTADLFLSSSVYEGYGMTVVEAMVAGCPILMTDTGVAGEIIKDGENGIVVPVGLVSKMAEAIENKLKVHPGEIRDKFHGVNPSGIKKQFYGINKVESKNNIKLLGKEEYLEKFKEIIEKCNSLILFRE